MVCGQPAFLGAPVLKTVLRNPGGHFPPPDPGVVVFPDTALLLVEGPCGFPEAIGPVMVVGAGASLEFDPALFATLGVEPPSGPLPQPGTCRYCAAI